MPNDPKEVLDLPNIPVLGPHIYIRYYHNSRVEKMHAKDDQQRRDCAVLVGIDDAIRLRSPCVHGPPGLFACVGGGGKQVGGSIGKHVWCMYARAAGSVCRVRGDVSMKIPSSTHLGADAGWCREHEEIQLAALGLHLFFNHEETERRDEELQRQGGPRGWDKAAASRSSISSPRIQGVARVQSGGIWGTRHLPPSARSNSFQE